MDSRSCRDLQGERRGVFQEPLLNNFPAAQGRREAKQVKNQTERKIKAMPTYTQCLDVTLPEGIYDFVVADANEKQSQTATT